MSEISINDGAPRDFATLRALIMSRWQSLPRRLTQVATYALDNPDEIAFGTAASIAAKADVQPSTLVRFSQTLGYQGFSDLQDVFRNRLRDKVPSYDERLAQLKQHGAEASRAGLVLDGFLDAATRSLTDFRAKLDPEALDAAVAALSTAETVYLIGLRRSFPIAAYMAYAMGKLGIRNILVDGLAGLGSEQASFITARDAVLAISFTPYASETVTLTNAAKAMNARVVSITDSPFSPIAPIADVCLEIVEANFEGFRAMAATMAVAMALAVAVAAKRGEG
jgi:DNA-binding MurR/RpiR family transcriptional regulator